VLPFAQPSRWKRCAIVLPSKTSDIDMPLTMLRCICHGQSKCQERLDLQGTTTKSWEAGQQFIRRDHGRKGHGDSFLPGIRTKVEAGRASVLEIVLPIRNATIDTARGYGLTRSGIGHGLLRR